MENFPHLVARHQTSSSCLARRQHTQNKTHNKIMKKRRKYNTSKSKYFESPYQQRNRFPEQSQKVTSPRAPESWWDGGRRRLTSTPGLPGTLVAVHSRLLIHRVAPASHSSAEGKLRGVPQQKGTVGSWVNSEPSRGWRRGWGEELVLLSPAGTKTHHMRGTEEETVEPD